uniref:SIS domain-containing protein n=1 Tax=Cyclopterus lumpus TaxID=8103 RepID=A0A8C2WSA9_CYCLU
MAGSDWTCSLSSPDYEPSLPVSEKSNPLTRDIDRASANCIVRMLQSCDTQMFQEETGGTYQRLLSEQVVETLTEVAKKVEHILKDPRDSLIVLSGCGTSGRLAFLITSAFNRALRELDRSLVYSYIIAGADKYVGVCEGQKRVLFIGISCGLSAPFVAGQLDFCLQHPEVYTPVLVGFNPPHQARCVDERIPGCTFTFLSVVRRMQEFAKRQKAFLVNPAVGPEAVSGSSRMKGGSATKILLEVVLSAAHAAAFADGPDFCIAHEDFLRLVLPSLDDRDVVLLIYTHSGESTFVCLFFRPYRTSTSRVLTPSLLKLSCIKPGPLSLSLSLSLSQQMELSTKLVLNAVSTGAHVLKGKIYQNHMVDVQVTNSKLYCRATRLLQVCTNAPFS